MHIRTMKPSWYIQIKLGRSLNSTCLLIALLRKKRCEIYSNWRTIKRSESWMQNATEESEKKQRKKRMRRSWIQEIHACHGNRLRNDRIYAFWTASVTFYIELGNILGIATEQNGATHCVMIMCMNREILPKKKAKWENAFVCYTSKWKLSKCVADRVDLIDMCSELKH